MGDVVTTMTAIVVANAILLPLAAYGCVRVGPLPGVDWHWPFHGHGDENLDSGAFAPGRADDVAKTPSRGFAAQVTTAMARLEVATMTHIEAVAGRPEAIGRLRSGPGLDRDIARAAATLSRSMADLSEQVEQTARRLMELTSRQAEAFERLAECNEVLRQITFDARVSITDQQRRVAEPELALTEAFAMLNEGQSTYRRTVDESLHQLDHELAIAVRRPADLMAELNETAGVLAARLTGRKGVTQA